jgi:hypothetical protein
MPALEYLDFTVYSERDTMSIENRNGFNAFNLIALMLPEKYEQCKVRYYRMAVYKINMQ